MFRNPIICVKVMDHLSFPTPVVLMQTLLISIVCFLWAKMWPWHCYQHCAWHLRWATVFIPEWLKLSMEDHRFSGRHNKLTVCKKYLLPLSGIHPGCSPVMSVQGFPATGQPHSTVTTSSLLSLSDLVGISIFHPFPLIYYIS